MIFWKAVSIFCLTSVNDCLTAFMASLRLFCSLSNCGISSSNAFFAFSKYALVFFTTSRPGLFLIKSPLSKSFFKLSLASSTVFFCVAISCPSAPSAGFKLLKPAVKAAKAANTLFFSLVRSLVSKALFTAATNGPALAHGAAQSKSSLPFTNSSSLRYLLHSSKKLRNAAVQPP